jgi:hypothetical protein
MSDPNQVVDAIPGRAREFIEIAKERCDEQLDFRESSLAKLDDVAARWQSLGREEMLAVFDGVCFYLGEVIRRNLGGGWVDPRWKNPDNSDSHCYLNKVGGMLTVYPHKWVARRFLDGRSETFVSYYKRAKQKAKAIKRDLKKEQSPSSAGPRTSGLDKTTSIIAVLQLLAVLIGWLLCRVCARISVGQYFGLTGFLINYGYTLALIPMIWAPLMIYKNATNRIPTFVEKSLSAFGFLAIFVIAGLFGWLVTVMLTSSGDTIW